LNHGRRASGKKSIGHDGALDKFGGHFNQGIRMPKIGTEKINIFDIIKSQLRNNQTGGLG